MSTKLLTTAFVLKKATEEKKGYFFKISIELTLKYRIAKIFPKIFKLHGKWSDKKKNIFGV